MINLAILCVFLISVALTAASLVVSSQLRRKYKLEFFSTLLYLLAFYFMFGFYALWGQAVFIPILSELASEKLLILITNITILLGFPFIIFAWLMFIELMRELSGRGRSNWFITLFLVVNFSLMVFYGLFLARHPEIKAMAYVKSIYIVSSLLYTSTGLILLNVNREHQPLLTSSDRKQVSWCMAVCILAQSLLLLYYNGTTLRALIFIFLYFSGSSFLPLYFRYRSDLSVFMVQPSTLPLLDQFCRKYEISPREREVIAEICNGLSNQQIAEKLYISLQTVKDHTHRIYGKTEVASRAQLIRMVQDMDIIRQMR